MNSIPRQKAGLRKHLIQHRREISESSRLQKNRVIQQRLLSLAEIQSAKSVFCFVSFGTEVHTHGIINALLSQGKQLAIPKIIDSSYMYAIAFHEWSELDKGQLGILTPHSKTEITSKIDVIITPGLGFSTTGGRLGFGRGYYDKWFRANTDGIKIALAYEIQIVDEVPTDDNDINVDIIITEDREIRPR